MGQFRAVMVGLDTAASAAVGLMMAITETA